MHKKHTGNAHKMHNKYKSDMIQTWTGHLFGIKRKCPIYQQMNRAFSFNFIEYYFMNNKQTGFKAFI